MSSNSSRATAPVGEPPRPQVTYNLAALRLAQSSAEAQASPIHILSDAPAASTTNAAIATKATPSALPVAGSSSPSSSVPSSSASATAALLAALHIGGDDRTTVGVKADLSPSAPTAETYTTAASHATSLTPFAPAAATAVPVPRSSASSFLKGGVGVAIPGVQAPAPQLPGPAPFSTASAFPLPTVPVAQQQHSPGSGEVSTSDPSRRPMAMMVQPPTPPQLQQQQPPPLPPQPSQQLPVPSAPLTQQPLPPSGVAMPFSPSAPQPPPPRGANVAYAGTALVNPPQQTPPSLQQVPPPQPRNRQSQLQLPHQHLQQLQWEPQPNSSVAFNTHSVAPPAPPQPQQPFLPQPQLQQQQQPQRFLPQQPQQSNRFVPAPRTQRGNRMATSLAPDSRSSAPLMASSLPSAQNMPANSAVLPQPGAPSMAPPMQLPQQQQAPVSLNTPARQSSLQMPPPAAVQHPFASSQPQPQPSPFPLPSPQTALSSGGASMGAGMPLSPAPSAATAAMNLLPPAPQTLLSAKNLYNSVLQGVPPPLPASGASPPINAASRGSPSPSATAAAPTTWVPANAPALHNLDIQQVLQRMGISAHVAATPPSKMSAAATPVSATTTVSATDAVSSSPSTIPGINSGATEQLLQMLPQQQQQQQQQRGPPPPQPPLLQQLLEVPLNFYSTAAGATAGQRLPPQQRQQPQRSGQRNGRGRGGWQHFDPSQLQQQHSREQAGLPGYTQNSRAPPPAPPPVSQLTAQDPETLARFKKEYAQQEDAENVSEELKAQQASKLGTVGTLDEEVCLSLIESHDVTFVITDTGTGKSTRIPIALHKTHPDALIVNAQPRRTAAINLARRVAEVLDAKLGDEVGYSVRGEHIGDLGDTKVMYVTTYSLFIYFLWHEFKEKLPFTYIIVDEFHERTPDVEVILLMLKLWLKKHPKAFKLILCSATAQVEEWHNFFDGLNVGTYSRSPIMYPVREYFIEDLQKLVGFRTAPIEPQDSNNMVTSQQMHQLILVCKQLLEYLAKNTATQDSVLVFMPGRTQVELMTTWMRDNLEESVEPIAWYRDVELSVIQEALARSAVTRKKVYVATDIAEVSLTLPDVVFVIDAGTGKRPQVSAKEQTSYAFPPLRLLWETASNAQQRRGRVGRVQQGFYFSLLSQEHHKSLRESENRIKNAVLTELVLHSLLITQKPFAFFQLCNEKPDHGALSYSLHLLQDGGLIIRKDDALAEAERVALDRPCTSHVMDSPWNELIENALAAGAETAPTLGEKAAAPSSRQTDVKQNSNAAEGEANHRGDVDEDDNGANEDEEVRIPDAGDDAFQQCYYMTLRGVIAARAPVSVAAATNIFYGLLCGTPTLSMLAAAIESSKSPFHVPYTINNRVERAGMVRAVSQAMQRYHGSLQSDLICAMEVILEYMSMQRDGLSEEAQEEWCQERSVSRTRVVDTLNLFAQMKEQVSSVLPFPDVNDIDVLTAQFNQNAELLVLMLVASHTELAIQVQLDGPVAQRKGFVGHGMFFPLKCLKDESVPTVCPWDRTKISVPLSLQTIQRKVLAVFSSQVEPDLFALVVLVFSFKLRYAVLDSNPVPSYLMCVSHSGVRRTFQCDVLTAQQILQLRRIQCAQLRCMQLQVEERVKASESERLSALLRSANSDFGLPESAIQTPYLIPTVLQHGLKLLVSRVRGSPAFTALRQPITDFPAGTAYCKLQHAAELAPPILQSVLIHSSNGLSVAQPAASPVSSKSVEANSSPSAAAAASPVLPSTAAAEVSETVASKSDAEDDGEASAKSSESSSESGSEDHVATFRYDL